MGKVESAIRLEISRLARREARQILARSVGEVRRLNRKVALLAGELDAVRKRLAQESTRTRFQQVAGGVAVEAAERARLSRGLIKKLRRKLKLTQPELARLLGVSVSAVGFWESGRVRPRPEMKAKIIGLRSLGRRDVRRLLEEQKAAVKKAVKPRKARKPAKASKRAKRKKG